MHTVVLIKRELVGKQQRWYTVHLQGGLWGNTSVVCRWGGIGNVGGQQKITTFQEAERAHKQKARIVEYRQRRGYVMVGNDNSSD